MEEILDEIVPTEDLKKYEAIYYRELSAENVTRESTFNYAWCLVRSKYASDIRKGITMLENLFRDGTDKERRDYVYFMAIGNAKIRDYSKALEFVRTFLALEPGNQQVQNLEVVIKKRMEKDGLKGIAIVGGSALAVGALAGLAFMLAKK